MCAFAIGVQTKYDLLGLQRETFGTFIAGAISRKTKKEMQLMPSVEKAIWRKAVLHYLATHLQV